MTALCFSNSQIKVGPSSPGHNDACVQSVVNIPIGDDEQGRVEEAPLSSPAIGKRDTPSPYCGQFNRFIDALGAASTPGASPPKTSLRLEIRSVGEIIQFLGDLLEYQEQLDILQHRSPPVSLKLHDPVTFGFCLDIPASEETAGCDDIFFNLRHDICNSRFSLTYRGERYSVPNYAGPNASSQRASYCANADIPGSSTDAPRDHTLEVLAVVHQLIDLQKSAQDIRETPYVQVLP
jgi:hypothetical protein